MGGRMMAEDNMGQIFNIEKRISHHEIVSSKQQNGFAESHS